jgi:hypothetical protein
MSEGIVTVAEALEVGGVEGVWRDVQGLGRQGAVENRETNRPGYKPAEPRDILLLLKNTRRVTNSSHLFGIVP